MNRKLWRFLIALLWLALPVVAFRYWMVWDQLPLRMASHFDASGNANGWMSREQSLIFTLAFVAFMLTVFSVTLFAIHRKYPVGMLSWALLIFFHLEMWTIVVMMNSTLNYNLHGGRITTAPVLIITPIGILALIAIGLGEKRGVELARTDTIAEEVHSGKAWGLLFILPMLGAGWAIAAVPNPAMRIGSVLLFIIFAAVFGMAWDGFHYSFTRHGLEIRTLGFRVKSIPADQIKQYAVERWNPIRGYGIRGLGNNKAYVWGNQGVRVHMNDGEVFLGHSDPQRIIHDLDAMKQLAH